MKLTVDIKVDRNIGNDRAMDVIESFLASLEDVLDPREVDEYLVVLSLEGGEVLAQREWKPEI